MAVILELRTDQGVTMKHSFQDHATVFYVEQAPSLPLDKRTVDGLRIGDRVSVQPSRYMELVNVKVA